MGERVRIILGECYNDWITNNGNQSDLRERVGDPRSLLLARIIIDEQLRRVSNPTKQEKAKEIIPQLEPIVDRINQGLANPNTEIRSAAIESGTKILEKAVEIYRAKPRH